MATNSRWLKVNVMSAVEPPTGFVDGEARAITLDALRANHPDILVVENPRLAAVVGD
jgi:hypothetical protein